MTNLKFNYSGVLLIAAIILSNVSFILLNNNLQIKDSNDLFNKNNNKNTVSLGEINENLNSIIEVESTNIDFSSENTENNPMNYLGYNSGSGSGIYSATDEAILTSSASKTIQNTRPLPDGRTVDQNLEFPSNYDLDNGNFTISNLAATDDYKSIERDRVGNYYIDSNNAVFDNIEVAMEFDFDDWGVQWVNVTQLSTYTSPVPDGLDNYPTGEIFIVNSTWGGSSWEPTDEIVSEKIALDLITGWRSYTFNNVLLKTDRHYFAIMNDTSSVGTPYWNWGVQRDGPTNGDNLDEGDYYLKYQTHGTSWIYGTLSNKLDLDLFVRGIAIEKSGLDYNAKTYTPNQVGMTYNTTLSDVALGSSYTFSLDDVITHNFYTNMSVTFTLAWDMLVVNSAAITINSNYHVINNSIVNWNLTFTTPLLSSTYSILNKIVTLTSLQNDWDGTNIYWNDTLRYSKIDNNLSIIYTNKSSTMGINTSIYTDFFNVLNWIVSFSAENYIDSFSLERNSLPITIPCKANITDLIDPIITLTGETGGNVTLTIEKLDGTQLYRETGLLAPTPAFTTWDINSSINQLLNNFGNYKMECFWFDSTNDRVGYYSRIIDITIDTTLESVLDLGDWVLGTDINLAVSYNSVHNNTGINGAIVNCLPSWDVLQALTNTGNHDNYTLTLNTATASLGAATISVNANAGWHINRSLLINVFFVENTTMDIFQSTSIADFGDLVDIKINYRFVTLNTTGITGATVTVNGSSTGVVDTYSNGSYYYTFDTTVYSAGNWVLEIEANKLNHMSQFELISISIIITETNLDLITTFSNNSIIPIIYSENYDIGLRYRDTNHDELLDGTMTITNLDNIEYSYIGDYLNYFNFTFTMNMTGLHDVVFSFSEPNYQTQNFYLTFNVTSASTSINATDATIGVLYLSDYGFTVTFSDTDHFLNIDDALISITGNCNYLGGNVTGDYQFIFIESLTSLGSYDVVITFQKYGYDPIILSLTFNVETISTVINANNATINLLFLEDYGFEVAFTDTDYNVNVTNTIISITGICYYLGGNATGVYQFMFNQSLLTLGTYNVDIIFQKYGYDPIILSLTFNVETISTVINANNATINLLFLEDYGFEVAFTDTDYNVNVTNTIISITGICYYLGGNATGVYQFMFNQSLLTLGTYNVDIIFQKYGYDPITLSLTFNVETISTVINVNNATINLLYFEDYVFEVAFTDIDYNVNVTDTIISITGVCYYLGGNATGVYQFMFNQSLLTLGTYNVDIIFQKYGYDPILLNLIFEVTPRFTTVDSLTGSPLTNDTLIENYYGDVVTFNWTWYSDNDSIYLENWQYVNVTGLNYINNTYYDFEYQYSAVGLEVITLKFLKYGYYNFSLTFSIRIYGTETEVVGLAETTYNTYYLTTLEFAAIYNDTEHNINLTNAHISIIGAIYYIGGNATGQYQFLFNESLLNSGMNSITVTFSKTGYEPVVIDFFVFVDDAPTVLTTEFPDLSTIVTNYTFQSTLWIEWNETQYGAPLTTSSPSFSGTAITSLDVSLYSTIDGRMTFLVIASSTGTYTLRITFSLNNYQSITYELTIIVNILSTEEPNVLLEYPAVYESETITIYIEWKQNDTIQLTNLVDITAALDSEIWTGFEFSIANSTHFQVLINTSQMIPQLNNLSLLFELYGYESQNITLTLDIRAHKVSVQIILPSEEISQGNVFDIIVYLTYNDLPLSVIVNYGEENSQKLLIIYQDSIPVIGGEVNLRFIIKNEDDTTLNYSETLYTNSTGYARFEIEASQTENAVELNSIQALYLGSDFNDAITANSSIVIEVKSIIDINDIMAIIEENIILILGVVILLIIFGALSVKRITKGRRKKAAVKRHKKSIMDSFKGITNVQAVICRHDSGVPFYTENLFEDQQRDADAIAGVTMAITTFVQELASKERKIQEVGTFERMEHAGFNMLSHHLNHSTVTLISSTKQTVFVEERLQKAHLEIQLRFQELLGDFYMPESINPKEVKVILEKTLLLAIIKPLTVNLENLKLKKKIISKNTKKILSEYKEVPSFSTSVNAFFTGTIVNTMQRKGFENSDIVSAIIDAIDNDVLVTLTEDQIEEIGREHRVKEDESLDIFD